MLAGKLFPVFCASGLRNVGIQPLADAIVTYVPSPADRQFPGPDQSQHDSIAVPVRRAGDEQPKEDE